MGSMVDGVWKVHPIGCGPDGRFARKASGFGNWLTKSGDAGPSGMGGYRAQSGRYQLNVSLNCPWASGAAIMRRLKRLNDIVVLSIVH